MMLRPSRVIAILLISSPHVGVGQPTGRAPSPGSNCGLALPPLIVFSDPWLPRETEGGILPFGGGPKPWEFLAKELKEPGRSLLDVNLEFNDRLQPKTPKAEYLISSRALVRVALPSAVGPDDFSRGATVVGEAIRTVRRWACDAPVVRIAAEGVAGLHVRAYLQSTDYRQDISQLINIGVPQQGGILQQVLGRLGAKGSRPCLAQLGLSEELATSSSPQLRAYLTAIAPNRAILDSLNRVLGRWRPLPLGLDVIDLVVDADSLQGRTANCSRAWATNGTSDNGIATTSAQRFPVTATADLRAPAVTFARGLAAATVHHHPGIARTIRDAERRPLPRGTVVRPVKDSLLAISYRPGLRSGTDEALISQALVLRRSAECAGGGRCTESDTAILFSPAYPLEALRLPRLDSLRRTTLLSVFSATQSFTIRPAYQALVIDHYRGPTFVVVDSSGRLGKVEPRVGVFPNGLRGIPSDSLCLQGEGRVEGPAGSPGTVRALSTLRLCTQVKMAVVATPAPVSVQFPVPRFAEWDYEVDDGYPRCELIRDFQDATPSDSTDGARCGESTAVDSLKGRPRELRFLTRPGRRIQLGKGTLYVIIESEMSRIDSLLVDLGVLYGEAKIDWIPVKPEDRLTWSIAKAKADRPEAWDPERRSYAMGRFAFYQIDADSLNEAPSPGKAGERRERLPDELGQIAIRIQNAVGPIKIHVIIR